MRRRRSPPRWTAVRRSWPCVSPPGTMYRPWRTTSICSPNRCASSATTPSCWRPPSGPIRAAPCTTAPCRRTRSCPCAPNMVSCCKKNKAPAGLVFYSFFPVQPPQLPPQPEQPAHPPFFRARRALRRASTPHSATSASSTQSIQFTAAALPQRKRCTPPATPLRIAAAPRPPF